MIIGYANGTDSTIDISSFFSNSDNYDVSINFTSFLFENLTIDNNIFGYIPDDQILLISIPDEIFLYQQNDESNPLQNNSYLNISEKFTLKQNINLTKTSKYYYIEYDIDRPYYITLYDLSYVSKYNSSVEEEISECNDRIKRGYFNSKTEEKLKNLLKQRSEHEERYRLYKELDSLVNEENYKSQSNYKSKLAYYIQKYENPGYYIINPRSGNFEYFGNEETLNKYLFKISPDNKYLIVYTEKYDGGTRTDRWKTFEYKGRRYNEFWFDTNTGNFVENKDYLIKDWEVELDVHNGWHPFDDD
jgi:hypothetical protein